jgi:hypothetical protein
MRYNFVIIVEPKFLSHSDEKDKERICCKLAKTIEKLRGVKRATIDWEGTIGEQPSEEGK